VCVQFIIKIVIIEIAIIPHLKYRQHDLNKKYSAGFFAKAAKLILKLRIANVEKRRTRSERQYLTVPKLLQRGRNQDCVEPAQR
jgi:hypothetical protein